MSTFDIAFYHTIAIEGDYANDPDDRGQETYKGISRKWFPNWIGWPIVDALKKQSGFPKNIGTNLDAATKSFYHTEFWVKYNINLLENPFIAAEVFDTAVNVGPQKAIKFLQEAMNLCNQNAKLYGELTVDGNLGPKTARMVNQFPKDRIPVLLGVLNLLQGELYLNICRKDPTQEKFLHGWVGQRILISSEI